MRNSYRGARLGSPMVSTKRNGNAIATILFSAATRATGGSDFPFFRKPSPYRQRAPQEVPLGCRLLAAMRIQFERGPFNPG